MLGVCVLGVCVCVRGVCVRGVCVRGRVNTNISQNGTAVTLHTVAQPLVSSVPVFLKGHHPPPCTGPCGNSGQGVCVSVCVPVCV